MVKTRSKFKKSVSSERALNHNVTYCLAHILDQSLLCTHILDGSYFIVLYYDFFFQVCVVLGVVSNIWKLKTFEGEKNNYNTRLS